MKDLPSECYRYADMDAFKTRWMVTPSCEIPQKPHDTAATLVVDYLSLNNQAWVWKYLEEDSDNAPLAWALEHGNITAVTEGSYFPEHDKTRGELPEYYSANSLVLVSIPCYAHMAI